MYVSVKDFICTRNYLNINNTMPSALPTDQILLEDDGCIIIILCSDQVRLYKHTIFIIVCNTALFFAILACLSISY